MTTAEKRSPLGRGLNALFGEDDSTPTFAHENITSVSAKSGVTRLPLATMEPGPFQPRKIFTDEGIEELAMSLKQHGMVQPIVVRAKPGAAGQYEIIAGERRWRAAQRVPLHEVPVVIQEIDDKTALEIALIENLQRADLNAVEEARAYQRLIDEYAYKHDQLATVLGKSRSHISNMLRLLQLPESVQQLVLEGALSMGHARALITAPNAEALAKLAVQNNLSVREIEKLATRQANNNNAPKNVAAKTGPVKDADIRALEQNLSQLLGLNVEIDAASATQGKISITYKNLDQLDDVLRRLSR